MDSQQEPASYRQIITMEYKRYISSIDEALDTVLQKETHADHPERTKSIHTILRTLTSLMWDDYIINGIGETLTLHSIDEHHELIEKPVSERSQLETYLSSLRHLLDRVEKSFIVKVTAPVFGLEEIRNGMLIMCRQGRETLKYIESVASWLERYLTWIEHGAEIATVYSQAAGEETNELDMFVDSRVRAYAILKISNLDPKRLASAISNINDLVIYINAFANLRQKIYSSISTEGFEKLFNAVTSRKEKSPNYADTKFENIHELNEYIRQRTISSLEESDGFLYNIGDILEEARASYIDKLATDITELLYFLPSKKSQEVFIEQFESGKLWLDASLSE